MKKWMLAIAVVALMFVLAACGNNDDKNDAEKNVSKEENNVEDQETSGTASEGTDQQQVEATFKNAEDKEIGTAMLKQTGHGVDIELDLKDVPKGVHGFHIHEKGSCVAPDFKSAGGHFNPTNKEHGFDNPGGPHAGDLPNLTVKEDGVVKEEFQASMVTLEKGLENSLLKEGGTALVIHADPDDNKSQPAGNAGDRIACAEITE